MKITYTDFLVITDSIRNKLYEYSFPAVERDIIMNALGLYGARIPGKLEPAAPPVVDVTRTLEPNGGAGGSGNTQHEQCAFHHGSGRRCRLNEHHLGKHELIVNGASVRF